MMMELLPQDHSKRLHESRDVHAIMFFVFAYLIRQPTMGHLEAMNVCEIHLAISLCEWCVAVM
jgi:hypothetical protein